MTYTSNQLRIFAIFVILSMVIFFILISPGVQGRGMPRFILSLQCEDLCQYSLRSYVQQDTLGCDVMSGSTALCNRRPLRANLRRLKQARLLIVNNSHFLYHRTRQGRLSYMRRLAYGKGSGASTMALLYGSVVQLPSIIMAGTHYRR